MDLKSLDGLQLDSTNIIETSRDRVLVEFRLKRELPSKYLWNVTVLANGCEEDTVVEGFELSMLP